MRPTLCILQLVIACTLLLATGCAGVVKSQRFDHLHPEPVPSEDCFIESLPGPIQGPVAAIWGEATAPLGPVRPPHSKFHPVPTRPVFAPRFATVALQPVPAHSGPELVPTPGEPTPAEPIPAPADPRPINNGSQEAAPPAFEADDVWDGELRQDVIPDHLPPQDEPGEVQAPAEPGEGPPLRQTMRLDTRRSGRAASVSDGWRPRL